MIPSFLLTGFGPAGTLSSLRRWRTRQAMCDRRRMYRRSLPDRPRCRCGRKAPSRFRQAGERAAWVRARIEVGGRDREGVQTHRICRGGFLSRDRPAAKPLFTRLCTAERQGTDLTAAVDHRRPFIVVEPTIAGTGGWLDAGLQRGGEITRSDRAHLGSEPGPRQRRMDQESGGDPTSRVRMVRHISLPSMARHSRRRN